MPENVSTHAATSGRASNGTTARSHEPSGPAPCARAASRSESCTCPTAPTSTREVDGRAVRLSQGRFIRHGGGLASGEVTIDAANEYVVPADAAATFRDAVPQLQSIMTRLLNQNGSDPLAADARQFQEVMRVDVSGTVRHEGEVTVSLAAGDRELLEAVRTLLARDSRGANLKVGDRVRGSLVGG